MRVAELSGAEALRRKETGARVRALQDAGECPTCRDILHGDVYPTADDRIFYQDDLMTAMLERYPRNPEHTIVLVKPHFEDIGCLPQSMVTVVYEVLHNCIRALKSTIGAEKVYMCTMCDGGRNHLHYQLIPRLPGDDVIGSRVFVKPRGVATEYQDVVERLAARMQEYAT